MIDLQDKLDKLTKQLNEKNKQISELKIQLNNNNTTISLLQKELKQKELTKIGKYYI